jgi:hypothetical protein
MTAIANDPPSYRNICKYICALKKIFPESNDSTFDTCVGYKLIESRATPISIKRAGNITRHKRDLMRLMNQANRE